MHQHANMILFLRLFFTFIKYIKTKFPSNETVKERQNVRQEEPCLNSIIEQIMNYHYNKCKSTNFDDEDSNKTAYEMYQEDNMEVIDKETEGNIWKLIFYGDCLQCHYLKHNCKNSFCSYVSLKTCKLWLLAP